MALNNELEAIIPRLLTRGLLHLRRYAVMPQLVNRDYMGDATMKGKTIDVDVPGPSQVKQVQPSHNEPEPTGSTWRSIPIALDRWVSADFGMTDKERAMVLADEKFLPKQANSAITALIEDVDTLLLEKYMQAYNYVGTSDKIAFEGSVNNAIDAGAKLKGEKVPQNSDLMMVVNPAAEAEAMKNQSFLNYNMSGTMDAIRDGTLEKRVGFMWHVNQGIIKHETEAVDGAASAVIRKGATTFVAKADMKLKVGDLISFAGEAETKVVKAYDAGAKSVEFFPPIKANRVNANAEVSIVESHFNNLAFHPDAIALATRPLMTDGDGMGSMIQSATDPISGLSLRLEVKRQYKQVHYEYDILYGGEVIRPEFLVRVISSK